MLAVPGLAEFSCSGQGIHQISKRLFLPGDLVHFQGQLGRSTRDVGLENFFIERISNGDFVSAAQEYLRMVNDILIQSIVLGQQDDR